MLRLLQKNKNSEFKMVDLKKDNNILLHPNFVSSNKNMEPLLDAGVVEDADSFYDNPKNYKTSFAEPKSTSTFVGTLNLKEKKYFHEMCELSYELFKLKNKIMESMPSPLDDLMTAILGLPPTKKQQKDLTEDQRRSYNKIFLRIQYLKSAIAWETASRMDNFASDVTFITKDFKVMSDYE